MDIRIKEAGTTHTFSKLLIEWKMKLNRIEKILIKLAVFHFVLLIIAQVAFHGLDFLPEVNKLAFYEGVNKQEHTEIVDVLNAQTGTGPEGD
jgi:hypothetical protein